MKRSRILAGILVFLGIACLTFGISRYFVETKVQQPAVLQKGVEDIGTGVIQASPEDADDEGADADDAGSDSDKGGDASDNAEEVDSHEEK